MNDDRLKKKSCDINMNDFQKYKNEICNFANHLVHLVNINSAAGIASIQVEDDEAFNFLINEDTQRKQPSIIVVNCEKGLLVMINPKIINHSEIKVKSTEGCLSIPGVQDTIERYESVESTYYDLEGNFVQKHFYNFDAIILQHEIDHLNGVLYPDHLSNIIKKEIFWKKYNNKKKYI